MKSYFRILADYYQSITLKQMDAAQIHQAKRCLLDLTGCVFAAEDDCKTILTFISSLSNAQECIVPGTGLRLTAPLAGFATSVLASAEEMDDATAIGASVHPGCCVIPAALAAAEKYKNAPEAFLRSIIFGYDLCNRLGLMATEKIRDLGLYGPGVLAAPCAAAVYGMMAGLDPHKLENAFSIAASMSPVCPFSSFTDGADSKLLYTGWGVYLGILSSEMARAGLTGPEHIIRGGRSLQSIFASDNGTDTSPQDGQYSSAVIFKDYAACLSTHAELTVLEELMKTNHPNPELIASIEIGTYPYACSLNELTTGINKVSARTSIPYTAAAMLLHGRVDPDAFSDAAIHDAHVLELMKKITVSCVPEYGSGPFGIRGSRVKITMQDGSFITGESDAAKWNKNAPATDDELIEKFERISAKKNKKERREALIAAIYNLDSADDLSGFIQLLK